jgi:glucose uptake protein
MIVPTTAVAVWILAIVSLLCLGSWANTLKLAGRWRFEYFYYDFVCGIVLCAGVAALALGSAHAQELTVQDNLILTGYRKMAWALGSGVVLNLGLLLMLAAMTIAGMSVAFPLTLGVALVIGAVWDFASITQANTTSTFIGVALLLAGVIVTGLAYLQLLRMRREAAQKALTPDPRIKTKRARPAAGAALAIVLSVIGGIALSIFPKVLGEATGGDNSLAPYPAVLLLSIAALLSSPFFVLFFTTFPVVSTAGAPNGYFSGTAKQHLMGIAGGVMWGAGMLSALLAAAAPPDARPDALVQYVLSHAALLVAAAWGLLAWREFRGGGDRPGMLAAGMMVLFLAGLGMVAFSFAPK